MNRFRSTTLFIKELSRKRQYLNFQSTQFFPQNLALIRKNHQQQDSFQPKWIILWTPQPKIQKHRAINFPFNRPPLYRRKKSRAAYPASSIAPFGNTNESLEWFAGARMHIRARARAAHKPSGNIGGGHGRRTPAHVLLRSLRCLLCGSALIFLLLLCIRERLFSRGAALIFFNPVWAVQCGARSLRMISPCEWLFDRSGSVDLSEG